VCKTYDVRKLHARARTEYGRLLTLEDAIRSVFGGEHLMASRAQKAAREMYALMNALNLRVNEYRDPRGRRQAPHPEALVSTENNNG
jgi:hypothetical protein